MARVLLAFAASACAFAPAACAFAPAPGAFSRRLGALRAVPEGMPPASRELLGLLGASSLDAISFELTMDSISELYDAREVAFSVGDVASAAGENFGSAKLLSFAKISGLERDATLALFGEYYTRDVRGDPDGADHPNIRAFAAGGWDAVAFPDGLALTPKRLQNAFESFGPSLGQEYQSGY